MVLVGDEEGDRHAEAESRVYPIFEARLGQMDLEIERFRATGVEPIPKLLQTARQFLGRKYPNMDLDMPACEVRPRFFTIEESQAFPKDFWEGRFSATTRVRAPQDYLGDVSRCLTKVLRHSAFKYYPQVDIDDYGFAPVQQLLDRVNAEQRRQGLRTNIGVNDLLVVVTTSAGRFQIFGYLEEDIVPVGIRARRGTPWLVSTGRSWESRN